jgi:hypothetical protein
MAQTEFYNVGEVSEILGLSRDRVYEYLRRGAINGSRLTKTSAWRIHKDEIERIKRGGGIKATSSDAALGTGFHIEGPAAPYFDTQKHRDTIIEAVIPELKGINVFPPRDFDLAIFWSRPNEPSWPISKGSITRQDGGIIVGLAVEAKLEWAYLRQHLKNDAIWDAIDVWKQAMVRDITARFGLLDKIVGEAQSRIGLPVLADLQGPSSDKEALGLYYAYTIYDQVFSRVVAIPLSPKRREEFSFEEPNIARLGGYIVVCSHDLSLRKKAIDYLIRAQVSLAKLPEAEAARVAYEEALSETASVKKHMDRIRLVVAFSKGSRCDSCR